MTARARLAVVALGGLGAAALLVAVAAGAEPFEPLGFGPAQDARAYWAADPADPYVPGSVGRESAYLYSPAFLQVVAPLRALDWTSFAVVWTGLLLAVLLALVGPVLFIPLAVLTLPELWGGNVTLLMAAAIVLGFRWPGTWAVLLLTKVTPGVGLLWFAARREWRRLAIAGATTAVVVAVSWLVAPGAWQDWLRLLGSSVGASTVAGAVPIPLLLRLPIALVVIAWAGRSGRRWLLPVGVLLAMPVLWWGSFSLLVASAALERERIERWLLAGLRSITGGRRLDPVLTP